MPDQATELRKLVLHSTRQIAASAGPAPRVLAVAGARAGVGVTTVALHLAVALTQKAVRVVLVDADLQTGELTTRCRIEANRSGTHPDPPHILDVLQARRDVQEVLVRGPAGIQLLPARGKSEQSERAHSEQRQLRLMNQLRLLGHSTDIVLLDAGHGFNGDWPALCRVVDDLLLITTPDAECIMDTYAAIKVMPQPRPALRLIVNRAANDAEADDVARRIHVSCEKFLEIPLTVLGGIPVVDDIQGRQALLDRVEPGSPWQAALHPIASKLEL